MAELSTGEQQALLQRIDSRLDDVDRRLGVLEAQEAQEPWHHPDGPCQTDFLSQMGGSPGIVLDPGMARATPCVRYTIGEKPLVYSKGILGALDPEQEQVYCPSWIDKEPTPAQRERIEAFQQSADACKTEIADVPKGEKLHPWLGCMTRELRTKGVKV